jgi:pilus assembly protein CpaE
MSRQALLLGASVAAESLLDQTLQRYGYSRIVRADTVDSALEHLSRQDMDLLVLAIDELDDPSLASIERSGAREHGLSIVATGPSTDPQLMLRAMRAGIQEYLVRPIVLADLVSAVERLHKRRDSGGANGRVFAVFCAKGGVGVSTVAVNLACSLATVHPDARVVVADLGLPGGDTSILLNVRPTYDMGDLAEKIDRLDAELLNSVLTPATDGLWVLPAPERAEAAELMDANIISSVIAQLRGNFEFTVLDCEHQLNDRTLAGLDAADRIVVLTELKVPALRSTQRTLGVFRRLGYPTEKLAVVVNRYNSGDVVSASEAAKVLKEHIFFKLPNDYKVAEEAGTAGVPITVGQRDSKLAWAFLQLAQRLAGGTLPSVSEPAPNNGSRLRQLFARKKG